MAVTTLAVQTINRTGLNPAFTAANADGHKIANNGNTTFLAVRNAGGTVCIVTLEIAQAVDGQTPAGRTVTVPITTGERWMGPFPKTQYNQAGADAGMVHVHFSQVVSVTCAAVEIQV